MAWASYPVGIGAVCALTASLLGCMFPLPRIVWAMADDGLLFSQLAAISPKTKTPVVATMTMASLAAIMAALFDTKELIDFMSIGTLMAYTLVAISVMVLRYRPTAVDEAIVKDYGAPSFKEYFTCDAKTATQRSSEVVSNCAGIFGE